MSEYLIPPGCYQGLRRLLGLDGLPGLHLVRDLVHLGDLGEEEVAYGLDHFGLPARPVGMAPSDFQRVAPLTCLAS